MSRLTKNELIALNSSLAEENARMRAEIAGLKRYIEINQAASKRTSTVVDLHTRAREIAIERRAMTRVRDGKVEWHDKANQQWRVAA